MIIARHSKHLNLCELVKTNFKKALRTVIEQILIVSI